MADWEYIKPTGDSATVNLSIYPASPPTHYDKVTGEDMGSYVKRTVASWAYDRYIIANPVYRGTDIKKIRLFALGRRNNPLAAGQFSIDSGGVYNTGSKVWGGYGTNAWEAWTFKLNPITASAWTLSQLDALLAGVGHYDSGIPSGVVTWEYFIAVIWTEAAVRADVVTDYDGSQATLNGTILQNEGNFLTKMTYALVTQQTRVRFNWGPDTSYGTDTAWQVLASGSFEADISGLDPAVTYHFRAEIQVRDNGQNWESFYSSDRLVLPGFGGDTAISGLAKNALI